MELKKELGQVVKQLRGRRGWAQKKLAAKASISRSMLCSYETGKKMPAVGTLLKIVGALGADLGDFNRVVEVVNGTPATVRELSAGFRPGQAGPSRSAARNPQDLALDSEGGGGAENEPQAGEEFDRALAQGISALHTILRLRLRPR
jgi:transcriptional regulator with XRE-family HTH domain